MVYDRQSLDDNIHENGVRATCLAPAMAPTTTGDETSVAGGATLGHHRVQTSFLSAGADKFLGLWNVDHSLTKKRIVVHRKEVVKIPALHVGHIQSLCLFEERNWVLSGGHDGKVFATDLSQAFHHTLCLAEDSHIFDIQTNMVVRDTIMVTTANKAPGSQFRYCDLRTPTRPVISFGTSPTTSGTTSGTKAGPGELVTKCHRKGSLHDNLFCYPNADAVGGVLLWDLRFLASSVAPSVLSSQSPPRRDPYLLGSPAGGTAIQTLFDGHQALVVLQKEALSTMNIVEEFI